MDESVIQNVARIIHEVGVHGRCEVPWERLRDDERLSRVETATLVLSAIGRPKGEPDRLWEWAQETLAKGCGGRFVAQVCHQQEAEIERLEHAASGRPSDG